MINGDRIKQAREICGWTQGGLAYRIGIKQPTLAQLEIGTDKASARVIELIAAETDFLTSFFAKPDVTDFSLGSLSFRVNLFSSRERTQAFRHAQLLFEVWDHLAANINGIPSRVPVLSSEPPVMAAKVARAQFGISPDSPISLMINLAEKNGVVVLAIPGSLENADAFSLWAGSEVRRPVIAVASAASGDDLSWNIARELGHLIIHDPIRKAANALNEEAAQFAAEFLLPEDAMREEIQEPFTLETFAVLKNRWRVSMQTLIRRALDLKILVYRQYTYLNAQIAGRGWRLAEPYPIPAEKPRGLREMAELIYGKPPHVVRLSKETGIGVGRLRQILNAHAQRSGETHTVPRGAKRDNLFTMTVRLETGPRKGDAPKMANEA